MIDSRLQKLANTLVNYSVCVKPGDWVLINGHVLALPLVEELTRCVLQAGGNPSIHLFSDELQEITFTESSDEQLQWISPLEQISSESADVTIGISAANNTRALSHIDPRRQQLRQNAHRSRMETFMRRSAEGSLRWVGTQFPCPAYAQDADMSLREYENFVYQATFCDQDDPIAAWNKVYDDQQHLVEWLKGKKYMSVRGPHIDMSLSIDGRTFINSDGKHNMPSGEIFTGPVEDSVNGWVKFNYPAIRTGREVEGVELEFRHGQVVRASARKNEEFLISQLDSDAGARYLGEFAFGTNYGITRFTRSILFDEKIGGTLHMALGAGYPETGSTNKSSIHWDLICDMRQDSEVVVDGELFYKNGQFMI